jgi:hypothetical protein
MDDDPYHDDYDFPPSEHPGREMATMGCAALLVLGLIVYAIWKLVAMM